MLQSTGSRGGNRIEQLKREDAPNHETAHERLLSSMLNIVMFMHNVLVSPATHVNLNMLKFQGGDHDAPSLPLIRESLGMFGFPLSLTEESK